MLALNNDPALTVTFYSFFAYGMGQTEGFLHSRLSSVKDCPFLLACQMGTHWLIEKKPTKKNCNKKDNGKAVSEKKNRTKK